MRRRDTEKAPRLSADERIWLLFAEWGQTAPEFERRIKIYEAELARKEGEIESLVEYWSLKDVRLRESIGRVWQIFGYANISHDCRYVFTRWKKRDIAFDQALDAARDYVRNRAALYGYADRTAAIISAHLAVQELWRALERSQHVDAYANSYNRAIRLVRAAIRKDRTARRVGARSLDELSTAGAAALRPAR